MRRLVLVLLVCLPFISGCAAGSATAGYSLKAGSSDELVPKARKSIIDEAFQKAKAYVDANFVRKPESE